METVHGPVHGPSIVQVLHSPEASGPNHLIDNLGNTCKVTTTPYQVVMETLMSLMVACVSLADICSGVKICMIMVKIICACFL